MVFQTGLHVKGLHQFGVLVGRDPPPRNDGALLFVFEPRFLLPEAGMLRLQQKFCRTFIRPRRLCLCLIALHHRIREMGVSEPVLEVCRPNESSLAMIETWAPTLGR
ncbi:MAG: hypothetical protein ACLPTZ_28695 [Beijerinckiaceae bacterium]